ncbi:MAG: hypothetical protein A2V98_18625 [Planctomycetes bacterium RBG_16_64_12]|nr:MAG: hypothetical protein A2V98_18625 [Planctomycetes bacterium RBG_16_64_12]
MVSSLPMAEPEPRIDPFFGKLFLSAADLKVPAGAVRLELVRTYRDRAGAPGLLGACWRLNWEARVVVATDSAMVEDGEDEDQVHFFWNANRQQYVSPLGDRLVIEGKTRASRWRLDGTKDVFDERGRLIERDLRNGNCVSLRYDAQGRLSRMEGPYQSYLDFRLDGNGRLVEVGSSQGTRVRYLYGATEVSEEAAKEGFAVRYGYHPSGLLAWIDYPQSGKVELTYDV